MSRCGGEEYSQWGRSLFSWKNGLRWYKSTLEGGGTVELVVVRKYKVQKYKGTVELVVVRKYDKCVGRRSHLAANDSL